MGKEIGSEEYENPIDVKNVHRYMESRMPFTVRSTLEKRQIYIYISGKKEIAAAA